MVCVSFATVIKITLDGLIIKDKVSGLEITCKLKGLDFEIKEGDEGLFLGNLLPRNIFEVYRVDKRQMLNPLYEKDLFGASGQYTMIEVIDNPFTELFLQLVDQKYVDSYAEQLVRQRDDEELNPQIPLPETFP